MCFDSETEFLHQLVMRNTIVEHLYLLDVGAHNFLNLEIPEVRKNMLETKERVEMGMLLENNYAASMSLH
jgi:hypothetical protein